VLPVMSPATVAGARSEHCPLSGESHGSSAQQPEKGVEEEEQI
jgi:hypothetical protein